MLHRVNLKQLGVQRCFVLCLNFIDSYLFPNHQMRESMRCMAKSNTGKDQHAESVPVSKLSRGELAEGIAIPLSSIYTDSKMINHRDSLAVVRES